MTKKTVSARILEKVAACEQHDHRPEALFITKGLAMDLVNEMYGYSVECWELECEHEGCNHYRESLKKLIEIGYDEKWGEFVGVPVYIKPDPSEEIEVMEE